MQLRGRLAVSILCTFPATALDLPPAFDLPPATGSEVPDADLLEEKRGC